MTILTSASSVTYQGNGVTTVFPFSFPVRNAADLQAVVTDNTQSPAALTPLAPGQYAVQGVGNPAGGSVTYPLSGSPLPTGQALTLRRVVAYAQTTSIVNQGGFYPDVIEGALDALTEQTQQLAEGLSRAVQVPVGSGMDPAGYLATVQAAQTGAAGSASAAAGSAASAAASAATAASQAATATASAASLPNAAAIGAGHIPVSTGSGWTGASPGAGTVTSVGLAAGPGITVSGSPVTGSGTITVAADVGSSAGKLVQLDSSGRLPAVDGSALTGLSAANLAGNLGVARFNGGSGASAATFWRGDGTWAAVGSQQLAYSGVAFYRSPGTYTWTVPAGVTSVIVELWGATGGTCTCVTSGYTPGYGGIGGYGRKRVNGLTPGSTVTVTVGARGANNPSGPAQGGGTTSFGSYCSATGGGAGSYASNGQAYYGINGANGSAVNCDISLTSWDGTVPFYWLVNSNQDGTVYVYY